MTQTKLTERQLIDDVLTGTEHTAIGDGAPHHAAVAGANPTAQVGLAAVDGVATTYIRSDGAPALNPADVFQRGWFYA